MINAFTPLKGDDVLLFNQETFTVTKFKELINLAVGEKILTTKTNEGRQRLFTTDFCTFSIGSESEILLNELQWCNSSIDCQLLRVGSQGWQKGKLRVQVGVEILASPETAWMINISVEFSSDKPTEPESPLDDLRQLLEYRQQP